MTDKNGTEVVVGGYVRAIPCGQDTPEIIRVDEVTGSGQDMGVEVLDDEDPGVLAKLAETPPFQGGGGTFGGGGASGSW